MSLSIMENLGISAEEVFTKTFPIVKGRSGKGYTILSKPLQHSEKILYRLLHWVEGLKINQKEFYKGHLVNLRLEDTGAIASFFFHKKEIACELWVPTKQAIPPEKLELVGPIQITCGVPGSKITNAPTAKPKVIELWDLLLKLLQTKTNIYPGNNFQV